ncbi:MAG: geranylgeranyl diphosphate synthase type I [Glaciecola sp.]|jgi:geranylgeranyl diphosphate synthase type I
MNQTYAIPNFESIVSLDQCEQHMLGLIKDNEPACFHLASGGSRTRAKLCIDAGIALELPASSIIALAGAVELLHNASLVHDDLQDQEMTRRGRDAIWKIYGKSHAICAGDAMISAAFASLAYAGPVPSLPDLLIHMHEAVAMTVRGQSRDVDAQNNTTEQEYEDIAAMKSGPLIRLTLELPLLMAGCEQYISNAKFALNRFSIAYQILDDLADWQQDAQRNQLNLVNLIASKSTTEEAIKISQNRAKYLLKQCEKELTLLPANCASSFISASRSLLAKTTGR